MPVIEIYSPQDSPGRYALSSLSAAVTNELGIADGHCWVMWFQQDPETHFRPEWDQNSRSPAPPIALVSCKSTYDKKTRGRLVETIARHLAIKTSTPIESVYVGLRLVEPGGLWVRGSVWNEEK